MRPKFLGEAFADLCEMPNGRVKQSHRQEVAAADKAAFSYDPVENCDVDLVKIDEQLARHRQDNLRMPPHRGEGFDVRTCHHRRSLPGGRNEQRARRTGPVQTSN
jgi:hypothetical protein